MEVVQFIYEETRIDFLSGGNENLMVNATQMAKIFGKEVARFMENDSTKKFIDSCLKRALKTRNSSFLNENKLQNSGLLGIQSEKDLIISKQKSGTWMHRILALKFAAWLDSDFEVWVFETIDQIILGHYKEVKEATIEKIQAQNELQRKKAELIRRNPELAEIFELNCE